MCGWGSGTGVWVVLWGLIWMALLVLLILGIVWLARKAVRPSGRTGRSEWDAEGTLRRRYAAGEIDAEEYHSRRETLRHDQ